MLAPVGAVSCDPDPASFLRSARRPLLPVLGMPNDSGSASFAPQILRRRQRRLAGADDRRCLTTGESPAHFA